MKSHPEPAFRRVGILGGMGPAATVDLMQKIVAATPARCDQDHVPLIVWNVPQIPNRLAAINDAGESPLNAMREGAEWLARGGAEAIVIACNTAHHWAEEISRAAGRPLLHIADAALAALEMRPDQPRRVMLLATTGTRRAGFYAARFQAAGRELELPDAADQDSITAAISQVKAGRIADAQSILLPVMARLAMEGVNVFLLSCTEIPLIVKGSPFEAQSVDATDALAHVVVAYSTRTQNNDNIPARHGDKVA